MTHRNFGLDLLRSISIFVVFMSHLYLIFPPGGRMQAVSMFFSMIDGVTIFFVLSGFLVGYRLIETFTTSTITVKGGLLAFLVSRWSKTLPSYYVILFLLLMLRHHYISENSIPVEKYVFFIQNFHESHPIFFEEAWSLSVEEWFYLLVPLLLTLLIKVFKWSVKTSFLIICFILLSVSHVARFLLFQHIDSVSFLEFVSAIRGRVITRIDAPIFGAVVAYYYYYFPQHFKIYRFKLLSAFSVIAAILLIINVSVYMAVDFTGRIPSEHRTLWKLFGLFYFDIAQWCAALCIPWLFYVGIKWQLAKDMVTYVSKISYSIYLVHGGLVIGAFLPYIGNYFFGDMYFGEHKLLMLFMYIALVTLFSLMLYHFVEMPFFKAKKRWVIRLKTHN